MTFDDDLNACAALVHKGDPDRFAAVMAAPVSARAVLFPLYAFNVEVSRAPWVTKEPIIAEMRLQWWRDALQEIASRGIVRRHEVVTPLALVLKPEQAQMLDALIEARRWDIGTTAFDDEAALWHYLESTTGTLLRVAAAALGAPDADDPGLMHAARGIAMANWMRALPALEAMGKRPLHDGRPETLADLAQKALNDLDAPKKLSAPSRTVLLSGWAARRTLRAVTKHPGRVAAGDLEPAPLTRSLSLTRARLAGRI